jgi:hypothetical protein
LRESPVQPVSYQNRRHMRRARLNTKVQFMGQTAGQGSKVRQYERFR